MKLIMDVATTRAWKQQKGNKLKKKVAHLRRWKS